MWDALLLPAKAIEAMLTATLLWAFIVFFCEMFREIITWMIQAGRDDPD